MTPEQVQAFEFELIREDEGLKKLYKECLDARLKLEVAQAKSRRRSIVESMQTHTKEIKKPTVEPF